jgi:hypothetical protein
MLDLQSVLLAVSSSPGLECFEAASNSESQDRILMAEGTAPVTQHIPRVAACKAIETTHNCVYMFCFRYLGINN